MDQIRKYELVMAITPMSNEDEINSVLEKIESYVNKNGGDLTERDNWGIKRLSYPIQKSNEGNYVRTLFSLQASAVKELEVMLNLTEEVLLHMVSKV
ncbi:MAG: 30S ribosomal protein S6 [SAR202 cluster bacterium]|nr:MAG: 30S ribosomal protein S6 [SAR202 cluster bacterium]